MNIKVHKLRKKKVLQCQLVGRGNDPGCREQGRDPARYHSRLNKTGHRYKNQGSAFEAEASQGPSGSQAQQD